VEMSGKKPLWGFRSWPRAESKLHRRPKPNHSMRELSYERRDRNRRGTLGSSREWAGSVGPQDSREISVARV